MCGIAGYYGSAIIDHARIAACLESMRHRGPDASGVYQHQPASGRRVYLLHTRLKILDLDDRANQPFCDRGAAMIYNGELYNYIEVARRLDLGAEELRTTGDTEVMFRVLADRGPAGLDDCEGMWALAFYREREGSLLLIRDRFGEKPLYVMQAPHGVYFASEIKGIAALSGSELRVNERHLKRYLVYGYRSLHKSAEGFFEGIESVPRATFMRIDARGRVRKVVYWSPDFEADETMTFDEAVVQIRRRIVDSMRLRLRADVPCAFLLSSGVDSNALLGAAAQSLGANAHAFTLLDHDERYDERLMVREAVRGHGCDHHELVIDSGDFLSDLRQLVHHHDAPVLTVTYFVHWKLLREVAACGYRIAISGIGADELFSGYYDHHLAYLASIRNQKDDYRIALENWNCLVQPLIRNPLLTDPDLFVRNPEARDNNYGWSQKAALHLAWPWTESYHEERYAADLLRNRMLNELFHETVPPILHEDDLNSMSVSVENRSPYLDRELFEFCQSIPTRHLVRNGFAKAVLREAARPWVPACVIEQRRKIGFNASLDSLIDRSDSGTTAEALCESPVFDVLRRDSIRMLWKKPRLDDDENKFLFSFLSAKMFLEDSMSANVRHLAQSNRIVVQS